MPLALPAVIIVALVALLVLLAFRALTQWLARVFDFDVGVGPVSFNLFGWINSIVEDAYQSMVTIFDALVQPIESLILAPVNAIERLVDSVFGTFEIIEQAISVLALVTIPNGVSDTVQIAADWVNEISAVTTSQAFQDFQTLENSINAIGTDVNDTLSAAQNYTDYRFNNLIDLINSAGINTNALTNLVNSAVAATVSTALGPIESDLQTVYNSATSYAGSLFADAEHDISAALTGAEAAATTAITAGLGVIVTDIDHAISGALSGIYTDVDSAVAGAITAAGDVDIDIVAGLRAIPVGAIGDIAALATLTGATALTLTRYLEECGIPNCRNLSQYGKELQALLGLVGGADFLELIIELAQHPSQGEQIIQSQFGDILSGTTTAFRSLIGV